MLTASLIFVSLPKTIFLFGIEQSIPGMPKIRDNYNPATWILEVTSASAEIELGIDFAEVYNSSVLCQ